MSNRRTTASLPRLRLGSPDDILAAIPYLLGFHPDGSLVVLGLGGRRCQVRFTARADLPPVGGQEAPELAPYLADVVGAQPVREAILVAYGPPDRADPTIELADQHLRQRDISIREALRAHHDRYWSYLCADPRCCPPAGTPYDVSTSAVAAAATVAGLVALPDRGTLERSVAPLDGVARVSMQQATARAESRLEAWAAECADSTTLRQRMVGEGSTQVRRALQRCAEGHGGPPDDETAWLCLLLGHLQVRDEAWLLIDDERRGAHLSLWTHLVRRAEPPYVPAPACLLAFAAWQNGEGALASIAIERALQADPDYSMAGLLSAALTRGVRPEVWRPSISTNDLRDLYARAEERDGAPPVPRDTS